MKLLFYVLLALFVLNVNAKKVEFSSEKTEYGNKAEKFYKFRKKIEPDYRIVDVFFFCSSMPKKNGTLDKFLKSLDDQEIYKYIREEYSKAHADGTNSLFVDKFNVIDQDLNRWWGVVQTLSWYRYFLIKSALEGNWDKFVKDYDIFLYSNSPRSPFYGYLLKNLNHINDYTFLNSPPPNDVLDKLNEKINGLLKTIISLKLDDDDKKELGNYILSLRQLQVLNCALKYKNSHKSWPKNFDKLFIIEFKKVFKNTPDIKYEIAYSVNNISESTLGFVLKLKSKKIGTYYSYYSTIFDSPVTKSYYVNNGGFSNFEYSYYFFGDEKSFREGELRRLYLLDLDYKKIK